MWGVQLALRTGPGDFNKLLVNHAHTIGRKVAGGRVWDMRNEAYRYRRAVLGLLSAKFIKWAEEHNVLTIPTPTEETCFEALGIPCWPPEQRTAQRLRQHLGK
jgi:hypothetical protein